ncbi:hypothetical protein K474DRAFT_722007 [Panus rudis PR-1116 ss-1]|nr:hypothetical protein K474DRAFT_722007 [Panus rudis PR-1116 ss-1]
MLWLIFTQLELLPDGELFSYFRPVFGLHFIIEDKFSTSSSIGGDSTMALQMSYLHMHAAHYLVCAGPYALMTIPLIFLVPDIVSLRVKETAKPSKSLAPSSNLGQRCCAASVRLWCRTTHDADSVRVRRYTCALAWGDDTLRLWIVPPICYSATKGGAIQCLLDNVLGRGCQWALEVSGGLKSLGTNSAMYPRNVGSGQQSCQIFAVPPGNGSIPGLVLNTKSGGGLTVNGVK